MTAKQETVSNMMIFRTIYNTLNHVFIGVVTVYITWLAMLNPNSIFSWHVALSTIGFQVLMAEAIMTLSGDNVWSRLMTRKTKVTVHWVMQTLGSGTAIIGISLEIYNKTGDHFVSVHAITGLTSLVLMIVSCLNGVFSLYASDLRTYIKPFILRLFHNCVGTLAFVIGMVSLIYGYKSGYITHQATENQQFALVFVTSVTIVLTLVQSLYNAYVIVSDQISR